MGKMVGDMGAAANAALIKVGDRLGLYKALAAEGPMTPAELAKASGTTERYVREWLSAQAAAGYIDYDATSHKFHMQPEQKMAFADDGVVDKLKRGATVADVGCGHGISTKLMARAFPNSRFFGFDAHPGSIEAARKTTKEEGLGERVSFATATAKTFPSNNYDLVCFFDCLHDMGDPVGALKHVATTLAADGTCLLVEPFANDKLEQNLNPVGSLFYAASTMICTPASMAQEVGLALGAQAGEARLRDVAKQAGLTRFRRATETPFNLILEARP
jgi:2-polyprenyl-3-methyl-5-hydroxy-6-metoxy-1,4-benzoquinol methylase